MRLVVKSLHDSPFIVEVTEQMTIFDVKQVISTMTGVLPNSQHLVHRGSVLPDDSSLAQFNLSDMNAIYLSVKRKREESEKPAPRTDDSLVYLVGDSDSFCDSICVEAQDPHLAHALNDREFLAENFMAMKNQSTRLEYLRSVDKAMNMTEGRRNGFRALVSRYNAIERAIDATTEKFMERNPFAFTREKTVIPPKAEAPSTDPLPFDFFPRPFCIFTAVGNGPGRGVVVAKGGRDAAFELMQFVLDACERAEESQKEKQTKRERSFWDEDEDEPEQIEFVQKFYDKQEQQHDKDCDSDWSDSDLSGCDID